jgi:hypothetical protein
MASPNQIAKRIGGGAKTPAVSGEDDMIPIFEAMDGNDNWRRGRYNILD